MREVNFGKDKLYTSSAGKATVIYLPPRHNLVYEVILTPQQTREIAADCSQFPMLQLFCFLALACGDYSQKVNEAEFEYIRQRYGEMGEYAVVGVIQAEGQITN